jgi:uncharacterized protein YndB with AHSA1/START domain
MLFNPDIRKLITFSDSSSSIEMKYKGSASSGMLCWLDSNIIKEWWKAKEAKIEPEQGGLFYLNWTGDVGEDHVVYGVIDAVDADNGRIRVNKILYIYPEGRMSNLELEIHFQQVKETKTHIRFTIHHRFAGHARNTYESIVLKAWPKTFALFKYFVEKKALLHD